MPQPLTPAERFGIATGESLVIGTACQRVVESVESVTHFELVDAHWVEIEVNGQLEQHWIPGVVRFVRADGYSAVIPFLGEIPGAVDKDVSGIIERVKQALEPAR